MKQYRLISVWVGPVQDEERQEKERNQLRTLNETVNILARAGWRIVFAPDSVMVLEKDE